MPDREKVIKGLERCLICDISVVAPEESQNAYRECEYTVGLYCGQKKLLRDAIDLLKEQELETLRCKECSYHREDGWCNEHRREVKESDYCSFGAWEGR